MFTTAHVYQMKHTEPICSGPKPESYYIFPNRDERRIMWEADPKKQQFSVTPSINSIELKLYLTILANNYLPDECYLVDLLFGNISIKTINLHWTSCDPDQETINLTCNRTIMIDNSQLEQLTSQNQLRFQIRFRLDKKPLLESKIDKKNILQLDSAMEECDQLNFSLAFSNIVSINAKTSGLVSFPKTYTFDGELYAINDSYYYHIMFLNEIQEFGTIKDVLKLIPIQTTKFFDLNDSNIQFDFFYHDHKYPTGVQKHFTISEKKYSPKCYENQSFLLPDPLQYKSDGTIQTSNQGSGFFLPYGGDGYLITTLDFVTNSLPRKISWKTPFSFKNSFNKIKTEARTISIDNLSGFESFGADKNA